MPGRASSSPCAFHVALFRFALRISLFAFSRQRPRRLRGGCEISYPSPPRAQAELRRCRGARNAETRFSGGGGTGGGGEVVMMIVIKHRVRTGRAKSPQASGRIHFLLAEKTKGGPSAMSETNVPPRNYPLPVPRNKKTKKMNT